MSSIGARRRPLPVDERRAGATTATTKATTERGSVHPLLGRLDDREQQGRRSRPSTAPRRPGRAATWPGPSTSGPGRRRRPGRPTAIDDVDEEHRAPPEVVEQQAADERPDRAAGAGEAGPDGDRPAPLVGREDVGEDRQRRRHDQRRADAHDRPGGDELAGRVPTARRTSDAEAEDRQAGLQRALAAEPVAEGAGRQQQAGEDEGVGVDDPLELGLRGVERVGLGERRAAPRWPTTPPPRRARG